MADIAHRQAAEFGAGAAGDGFPAGGDEEELAVPLPDSLRLDS